MDWGGYSSGKFQETRTKLIPVPVFIPILLIIPLAQSIFNAINVPLRLPSPNERWESQTPSITPVHRGNQTPSITPVHQGNQTQDSEREKVITAEREKLKHIYKIMNKLVRVMGYETPVKRRRPEAGRRNQQNQGTRSRGS